jgi:hypothetical protein
MMIRKAVNLMIRNLDSLIAIVVALVITILSTISDWADAYINAAILLILTVKAVAMLHEREIHHQLREVTEQINSKLSVDQTVWDSGLKRVNPSYLADTFDNYCMCARREIALLTSWIRESDIQRQLSIAITHHRVPARFLLLDPLSPYARKRAEDLYLNADIPLINFNAMLEQLKQLDVHDNVEIRIYDAIPPFTLYIADEWMMLGFHWHHAAGSLLEHFEIEGRDTPLGSNFIATYDALWKKAVPLSEYIQRSGIISHDTNGRHLIRPVHE